jgi:uncharacterized membrane protein
MQYQVTPRYSAPVLGLIFLRFAEVRFAPRPMRRRCVLAILPPGIHSLSGELAIAGSVCYAAVIAIALTTYVRINYQIARWSVQSPPDDWTLIRTRWVQFHIIRTLFSLPAPACYILTCLVSR